MTKTMTIRQFDDLLDRLGPDLGQWPEAKAPAARNFLETSAEARAHLDQARRVAALTRRPLPDVETLKARILAAARATHQAVRDNVVPFPTRRVVTPAAFALAASLLFGVFAGWSGLIADPLGNATVGDDAAYDFQALIAGDNYDS